MLNFPLAWGERTYVMGILNITPDSFSGDGLLMKGGLEAALKQAQRFVTAGADILDIGGSPLVPVHNQLALKRNANEYYLLFRQFAPQI